MQKKKAIVRVAKGLAAAKPKGKQIQVKQLQAKKLKKEKKHEPTGKLFINEEGLKALDRKCGDMRAWDLRRRKECPPPGGWPQPPAHWPAGCRVDIGRPVPWLPEGWGQGVKTTCAAKLVCYISPEGRMYYHRHVVEQVIGRKVENTYTRRSEWARKRAKIAIEEAKTFDRNYPNMRPDEELFDLLSEKEARCLPKASALYFAVVSARRAEQEHGLRSICLVESQLRRGGATPVWYVDEASAPSYKALGLKVKVGGKLVPARNMALADAARERKACVQVSDDIQRWDYYSGDMANAFQSDDISKIQAGNLAARSADRIRVSPVAAARFLLAKLRALQKGKEGPQLAGVFPLGNTGQAFTRSAASYDHFILGDFFVADKSTVRFDTQMTLKEDYDFTCSHLDRHGSVLRCNRMFIAAIHETNAGGAVSERDESGDRERANIKILQTKWPGVFRINPKRGDTQVIMRWGTRKKE